MTSNSNNNKRNLLDQQLALHSYLDDLLQEIPDSNESLNVSDKEPDGRKKHGLVRKQENRMQTGQTQARQRPDIYPVSMPRLKPEPEQETIRELAEAPRPVMDIPVLRESQQVKMPEPVVETQEKIDAELMESKQKLPSRDEGYVPDWAQERFKCLLFKVAGVSLAVPLAKLNGVVSWSEKITPVPGNSRSFLGLLRHHERNVKVMDTAQIVLPEKQQEGTLLPPDQRLKNVILVDDFNWGLACDDIGEVITLEPGEVRWRTPKGKLKWLSGTVLQHLCALLEVDALARLLNEGQE